MKRKDYITQLQLRDPEEHIACIEWCADDVLERSKELEKFITKKAAEEIIDKIHAESECEYGITWQTVDEYIINAVFEHQGFMPDGMTHI